MELTADLMTKTWAHNLRTSQSGDWLRTWKKAHDKPVSKIGFAGWARIQIDHVHSEKQELDADRVY